MQTKADELTCPDEETITSYIEGSLDSSSRHTVDIHLDHCEQCAQLIIDLVSLMDTESDFEPKKKDIDESETKWLGKRYIVERMVGRGSMGSVYEAVDVSLQRDGGAA